MSDQKKYTFSVAVTLVIANMVGTGVFTSLGYQVGPIPSGFPFLLLWAVGGVVSLCGAFVYAELATTLKRSGGEYLFLSKVFHPVLGFLSGWTSMLVGFAGAVSAVAIAIGYYSADLTGLPVNVTAVTAILVVSFVHWFGVKTGGRFQNLMTTIKLSLIVVFCLAPFFLVGHPSGTVLVPKAGDLDIILSSGWAVSLVFVVYAYSGWNASAYIAGNLENAEKNLPRSLVLGTLVVTIVYLCLNTMFLYSAPMAELEGQNDVGNVVAMRLFGPAIGTFFSALFSFALLSTLSAMTIAGPRVMEAIGEDFPLLKNFARRNRYDMPYLAILFQAAWSIALVLISSFKEIIQYISLSLSIFTLLTVVGIFVLRKRVPASERPFKTPLFPLTPIIFIATTAWMIFYVVTNDPKILAYAVGTQVPGLILYFAAAKKK
ncbi:MAG: amino acid permease [Cyclobacteriaceae bacterium]|nr:amino acid permease [Cyclobacteriaceae bacterium]